MLHLQLISVVQEQQVRSQLCKSLYTHLIFSTGSCVLWGMEQGGFLKLVWLLVCTEELPCSSLALKILTVETLPSYLSLQALPCFWEYFSCNLYWQLYLLGLCAWCRRTQDWPWAYWWGTGRTYRFIPYVLPAWCHGGHLYTSQQSLGWLSMEIVVFHARAAQWEWRIKHWRSKENHVCVWIGDWYFSWQCWAGDAMVHGDPVLLKPLLFRWHMWPRDWQIFCSLINLRWTGVVILHPGQIQVSTVWFCVS